VAKPPGDQAHAGGFVSFNAGILPSMVRKSWSFKDDRRVMELARASKTLEQIAKAMDRSPERIRKVAIRLGVSIKSRTPKKKGRSVRPTQTLT
jgi:hypothetical protein